MFEMPLGGSLMRTLFQALPAGSARLPVGSFTPGPQPLPV